MFGFTLHHRDLRGQRGQLLCPHPRAGAAQLPGRQPAGRRGAQARPRRQRAWAGSISITWRWTRRSSPKGGYDLVPTARPAGLVRPLPAQRAVRAWPRWAASAALCASTRSRSRPRGCAPCRCRSRTCWRRSSRATSTWAARSSRKTAWNSSCAGLGLVESTKDLENIVLKDSGGTPVYLRDVATIQLGGDFRRGALDVDGQEVVGGVVVMRNGENGLAVIQRVKEKIAQITPSLPPGVSIKPFYDRSTLIERTLATLKTGAGGGNHPGGAGPHRVPLALPQHPDRDHPAAGLDPDFVHPDEAVRHHLEHHVAERHRHRHRRAGGCRHRDDRERDPALRAAGDRRKAAGRGSRRPRPGRSPWRRPSRWAGRSSLPC